VTVPFNYSKKCPKTLTVLKKLPKPTAWWSKISKNYRITVKSFQKIQHCEKWPKTTA
jgi:hypothetical protein